MNGPIGFENWTQAERDTWAADGARTYREKTAKTSIGSRSRSNDGAIFDENPPPAQLDDMAPPKWPEPKPLPDGLLPVSEFSYDFLPASIAPWVADIADRMQCPADFVGVPALVALGATLGRKIGIRPQRRTDWTEVSNLWGCIVGRPGFLKSPALEQVMKPLKRLEAEARKQNEGALKDYEAELAVSKIRKEEAAKKFRDAVRKGTDPGTLTVGEPSEPVARRYIVSDNSYEKLGEILACNQNGVLSFRDELVSLLRTLDREENAPARGFYLTSWNGTSSYTFDRITRSQAHIEAACLSMLGSTQPGRLADYIRRAVAGGAADDGLIQRFGLLVWPDQSPEWREVDRWPDSAARRAAWATFDALDALDPVSVGAEVDEYDDLPFLRFDDAGHGLFTEWRADLEARLRAGEMHPSLESHFSKYRKMVPVLAIINHLADGNSGPVGAAATLRALATAEYLASHARRAYASGREAEAMAAKAILRRIKKGDLRDGFTARELWRNHWAGLDDLDAVKAGLDLLVDLDWLSSATLPTRGRPRTTYTINPKVKP